MAPTFGAGAITRPFVAHASPLGARTPRVRRAGAAAAALASRTVRVGRIWLVARSGRPATPAGGLHGDAERQPHQVRSTATGSVPRPGQGSLARRLPTVAVAAAAAAAAGPVTASPEPNFTRTYSVRDLELTVEAWTEGKGDGASQCARITASRAGRLLLHWGAQGGAGYKGGWRLPGKEVWPAGTVLYKKRALQTPLAGEAAEPGGKPRASSSVTIAFPPQERSEALCFVLRDSQTGAWYDLNGDNFRVPLVPRGPEGKQGVDEDRQLKSPEYYKSAGLGEGEGAGDTPASGAEGSSPPAPPPRAPPPSVLASEDIPAVPDELAGMWAYRHWERAGRPNRSPEDADAEFEASRREIAWLLRRRVPLDAIREVAGDDAGRESLIGRVREVYDVTGDAGDEGAGGGGPSAVAPPAESSAGGANAPSPEVPTDLIGVEAYLLWEDAGKPPGTDFGDEARRRLTERLHAGESLADLRASLLGEGSDGGREGKPAPEEAAPEEAARLPPLPPSPEGHSASPTKGGGGSSDGWARLGEPRGFPSLNPWDFLRDPKAPPLLSEAREASPETAISRAARAAAADRSVVWRRSFALGEGATLLVAVRRDGEGSGPPRPSLSVTFLTDLSDTALLHWGIRAKRTGDEWVVPAPGLVTAASPSTELCGDGKAAETALVEGGAGEAAGAGGGAAGSGDGGSPPHVLRSASILVPSASSGDASALAFVLRSADGSRWWNDSGGGDFSVPLPWGKAEDARGKDEGADGGAGAGDPSPTTSDGDLTSLAGAESYVAADPLLTAIVDAERSSAWTLMHRFNRAADLVGAALDGSFGADIDASLAKIYVWLRYSQLRQLTWQRNYNTQPRILGEAQRRLTDALADAYVRAPGAGGTRAPSDAPREPAAGQDPSAPEPPAPPLPRARDWARLALGTLGRGSGAQKVRDDILEIMHRNRIPEARGTWMEEWHQKLHNNTTPDDVAICEAFLAFLNGGGDLDAYWGALRDRGLDRDALASYDRPITTEPAYDAGLREALRADFTTYLGTLRAVHDGLDLQAAVREAGDRVPQEAKPSLGFLLSRAGGAPGDGGRRHVPADALAVAQAAVEARAHLARHLDGSRSASDAKELLFLDLALEASARAGAEAGAGAGAAAAALLEPLLLSAALSLGDNAGLLAATRAWQALPEPARAGRLGTAGAVAADRDSALRAVAAADLARREVARVGDATVSELAAPAAAVGTLLGVEDWSRDLFAEEVVRAGAGFAVSLALGSLEPALRRTADLGSWQVISPGAARGEVVVADTLPDAARILRERGGEGGGARGHGRGTVVLAARRVTGEEDIPAGISAVLSPDAPDVLSHLAVRARNGSVLFAACHDDEAMAAVYGAAGRVLDVASNAAGQVVIKEVRDIEGGGDGTATSPPGTSSPGGVDGAPAPKPLDFSRVKPPAFCGRWAVGMAEFREGQVGAKSRNLAKLRALLPEGVSVPASCTLPYGAFEKALEAKENKVLKKELAAAVRAVPRGAGDDPGAALARCRELAAGVRVPAEAEEALWVAMSAAGVPVPEGPKRDRALAALRAVWASKYNERAFVSCSKVGLDFDAVRMAVLVQRIVDARYAFVIHTRNPTNGSEGEVYAELVIGLGEAIVSGTVPGSALAFVAGRGAQDGGAASGPVDPSTLRILAYPSKTHAFAVPDSIIFRSDSNGEDLDGYAGAGLYDSVTLERQNIRRVDYCDDPIVTDPAFARDLMLRVLDLGAVIHDAYGSAQDVEGVVDADGRIHVVQTRPQM